MSKKTSFWLKYISNWSSGPSDADYKFFHNVWPGTEEETIKDFLAEHEYHTYDGFRKFTWTIENPPNEYIVNDIKNLTLFIKSQQERLNQMTETLK